MVGILQIVTSILKHGCSRHSRTMGESKFWVASNTSCIKHLLKNDQFCNNSSKSPLVQNQAQHVLDAELEANGSVFRLQKRGKKGDFVTNRRPGQRSGERQVRVLQSSLDPVQNEGVELLRSVDAVHCQQAQQFAHSVPEL